jgi:hypothetical protein
VLTTGVRSIQEKLFRSSSAPVEVSASLELTDHRSPSDRTLAHSDDLSLSESPCPQFEEVARKVFIR